MSSSYAAICRKLTRVHRQRHRQRVLRQLDAVRVLIQFREEVDRRVAAAHPPGWKPKPWYGAK